MNSTASGKVIKAVFMIEQITECVCKEIKIENKRILLEINPVDGGRLTRLYDKEKDCELIWQNPRNLYAHRYYNSNYDDLTAGGIEEAFPTVEPCCVNGYNLPYFGEIWANMWAIKDSGDDCITLETYSPVWPARISKTFRLTEDNLVICYTIENLGLYTMDFVFGFHPGLMLYEDSRIFVPEGTYCMYKHPDLNDGEVRPFNWPEFEGRNLSISQPIEDRVVYNFLSFPASGGSIGVYHPGKGSGITVDFDEKFFKCLSLWPVYGSKKGHRCLLSEAFTSWPTKLSDAIEKGVAVSLDRGKSISTTVKFTVK